MDHQAFIFVSYSHKNASLLKRVGDMLNQIHVQTWVDSVRIPGGDCWREEIRQAIQGCTLFLLIATPQSLVSREVRKECLYAHKHHKEILIVTFNHLDTTRHKLLKKLVKYPVVHLPGLRDKALYTLLYKLYQLGVYPTPSGRFDPYLVLALAFHQHAPAHWQIRRVTKLWVARRWYVALSPLLVLLGMVVQINAHYLSGIADVPILGDLALALFIPMVILWLVTIVVVVAAFPILPLTAPPYIRFNLRGFFGYRDKLRMLRKQYFPEVAVVSDNGFVMHTYRLNREGWFNVIDIDFSQALVIKTQKTWTFGVKLVVTYRNGTFERFVLSRRFGHPKRLIEAIDKAFEGHHSQVVENVLPAADQKRLQEGILVPGHLPSRSQVANTRPIVICHTAETTNIAQTLETHLKGRVSVLMWNLSARRADTLPPQSCGVILIADKIFQSRDAMTSLVTSTHAQNSLVIPIKVQKSKPSFYPENQWIDFSHRSQYDLGCIGVDHALMVHGVLPQPSSCGFDEHVALASAIYEEQNPSVFHVPREHYLPLRRWWWLLLLFVWTIPATFIQYSIIALNDAMTPLAQSLWGIALSLLLLSLVLGLVGVFLIVFLAMHMLQIYRYLRFLWKKDKTLPEVITVTTDGVVCVLPRIWTRPFLPKRHVIAFKDIAELNMSRRRLLFWRYYVHYICRADGKLRRLIIPSRFNSFAVAYQILTQWNEYVRRQV
jgi:hypothetical protein